MTDPDTHATADKPPMPAPLVPAEGAPQSPSAGAPDPNLAMFLQAARDPGIDVAKLKELMAMWRENEKDRRQQAFLDARARAKGEIPPIIKTRLVDYPHRDGRGRTTYKYEELADIAVVVDPILAKYGLSYAHRTTQVNGRIKVTCTLAHAEGHSEDYSLDGVEDTSGQKSANQAIMSTVTFLQRGTLKNALGLAAGHDDDGRGGGDPDLALIDADQLAQVQQLLDETKSDLAVFFDTLGATGFSDLNVKQWKRGVALLEEKKRRAAKKAAQP
jgi:hypothetical protein